MPTLRELAEKKTPPVTKPAAPPRQLLLSVRDSPEPGQSFKGNSLPTRPAEPFSLPVPCPGDRLLGTENRSDVIPDYPSRGPGPETEWEACTLLPASSLGIVLAPTMKVAWLACSRPGTTPLLITPFPILGTITEAEPLVQTSHQPSPPGSQ